MHWAERVCDTRDGFQIKKLITISADANACTFGFQLSYCVDDLRNPHKAPGYCYAPLRGRTAHYSLSGPSPVTICGHGKLRGMCLEARTFGSYVRNGCPVKFVRDECFRFLDP